MSDWRDNSAFVACFKRYQEELQVIAQNEPYDNNFNKYNNNLNKYNTRQLTQDDYQSAIVLRRKQLGITQKNLAKLTGMSLRKIRSVERGRWDMFSYRIVDEFLAGLEGCTTIENEQLSAAE